MCAYKCYIYAKSIHSLVAHLLQLIFGSAPIVTSVLKYFFEASIYMTGMGKDCAW